MKLFALFTLIVSSASLAGNPLYCAHNGSGYEIRNFDTHITVGKKNFSNRGLCQKAADTYHSSERLVCSLSKSGRWNLFHSRSGRKVTDSTVAWNELSYCQKALRFLKNRIVCAPRSSGSGIWDLRHGEFIGTAYYFDINDCTWASFSAKSDLVCAPYRSYSAVFNRRYNEVETGERFLTAKQCYKSLQ